MTTLVRLIGFEFKLQVKYGLFMAGILMSIMWLVVLSFFPASMMSVAVPLVLLMDLATMGYMFVAAMIYFEKGQGSIHALMITPISIKEYVISKITAILIYTLAVSFVVVQGISILKGISPNYVYLVLSLMMTATVHMLFGILFAAKFDSFTNFLFPTGLIFMFLMMPMLDFINIDALAFLKPFYYLWPSHGLILLLRGIYSPINLWQTVYGLLYNLILSLVLYKQVIKAFNQCIVGREADIDA